MIVAFRPAAKADKVSVMLLDKVTASEFTLFREGCARMSAQYHGDVDAFIAKADSVPAGRVVFESLGFKVEVDALVAPVMERNGAQQQATLAVVREVIDSRATDWKIRPYQAEAVQWLAPRTDALLADDVGIGKTLEFLMSLGRGWRVLVVANAPGKYNWQDEARLRRPDYRTAVLDGRGSFRWPEPGEILMTSWEILPGKIIDMKARNGHMVKRVDPASIPPCPGPVALIGDEIHKIRNDHTQAFKRWAAVRDAIPAGDGARVWGGTGTELIKGDPMEYWNVLRSLRLETVAFGDLPRFIRAFGGERNTAKAAGGGLVAIEAPVYGRYRWPSIEERLANLSPDLIAKIRSVSLKRLKRDVLPELPGKTYQWQRVPIDNATKIECDKTLAALKEQGIDLADVQRTVELSAITGAAFQTISKTRAALAVAKIKATVAIIEDFEEQGEPVIVFSAHRAPVLALGKRPGWANITGSTTSQARRDIMRDFQAGKYVGLAGVIGAMGTALTLTRACTVVFVDLEWVPELNRQAEERAYRFGQTRGVVVWRLYADHVVDHRTLELLAERQAFIEATTERSAVKPGMVECA